MWLVVKSVTFDDGSRWYQGAFRQLLMVSTGLRCRV